MTRRPRRDPRWSVLELEEREAREQLPKGDPQTVEFWRAVWGVG